MSNRIVAFSLVVLLAPGILRAQRPEDTARWTVTAGVGTGYADVPRTADPVYFDATQISARLAVQRVFGAGVSGGLALNANAIANGSDCALGPCAPHVRQHVLASVLSYMIPLKAVSRFVPIASLGAGIAWLPEQWAAGPKERTTAASTLSVTGALDFPVYTGPRNAVLIGWESGVLPNAPGGAIKTNGLVLTVRHVLTRRIKP